MMTLQFLRLAKKCLKLTACIGVLAACEPQSAEMSAESEIEMRPNVLTRAIYSATFQLDPHFVSVIADAAPLRDLYVGLTRFNLTGEIVPAIAQEWFSEDGKEWLFVLNEKAKWSNGEPVTAHDFVASWQRLAEQKNTSALKDYLLYADIANVQAVLNGEKPANSLGVHALNNFALQIKLERPNFQLPKMLAHISLLPTYQGKAVNANHIITNGDYQVETLSDKKLTLRANTPISAFQQVEYHLIETVQNAHQFDLVENPLTSQTQDIQLLPRQCSYYYEFNFNDPDLRKKEVRLAIRTMLASAPISSPLGRASRFLLPEQFGIEPLRSYTSSSVEQLLKQAEITSKKPLRLNLYYNYGVEHRLIANHIARTLGQSDLFRVNQVGIDATALLKFHDEQRFHLIRSGWCSDSPDPVQFLLPFHSQSPDNKSGYHNAYVDSQLERLQKEALTEEERMLLIKSIVQHLDNDVAVLPILYYQRRIALNPSIRGIDFNNQSEIIYSKDLYREKLVGQTDESTQ